MVNTDDPLLELTCLVSLARPALTTATQRCADQPDLVPSRTAGPQVPGRSERGGSVLITTGISGCVSACVRCV